MSLGADIEHWIARLSEPRREFNGYSACPFAKGAKYHAISCRGIDDARNCLLALDPPSILIIDLPLGLTEQARVLIDNTRADLRERGLWAFISDPHSPVVIQGFRATQEQHLLIIVQPYDELVRGAETLARHGYYDHWDLENLERIKGGR